MERIDDRDEAKGLIERLEAGALTPAAAHDRLTSAVEALLAPIRARRVELARDEGLIEEIEASSDAALAATA